MVVENLPVICKRIKLILYIKLYTKINANGIKDLNVRPETINL